MCALPSVNPFFRIFALEYVSVSVSEYAAVLLSLLFYIRKYTSINIHWKKQVLMPMYSLPRRSVRGKELVIKAEGLTSTKKIAKV